LQELNLIDALTYYLWLALVVGMLIRARNYRAILGLIVTCSARWPKLLVLVRQFKTVFIRWPTLLPVGLALVLAMANALASHWLLAQASVTPADLGRHWLALMAVTLSGVAMVVLDCRAVFRVGRFDRAALEANLDRAEHWLQSWKAPALRFVTLGLINPRKIVSKQVEDALVKASLVVNGQVWSWARQIVMRLAFGLTLWSTWGLLLRGTTP
jgi:hypothetical protein